MWRENIITLFQLFFLSCFNFNKNYLSILKRIFALLVLCKKKNNKMVIEFEIDGYLQYLVLSARKHYAINV